MEVEINRLDSMPFDLLAPLVEESEGDGWRFVRRLVDEWIADTSRFDRFGEVLFAARSGRMVVGVCGLNADPYVSDPTIGRIRHLYVLRACRGQGIGLRLVQAVIHAARGRFQSLRLRTENGDAGRLYERLGFEPTPGDPDCTHFLGLIAGGNPLAQRR